MESQGDGLNGATSSSQLWAATKLAEWLWVVLSQLNLGPRNCTHTIKCALHPRCFPSPLFSISFWLHRATVELDDSCNWRSVLLPRCTTEQSRPWGMGRVRDRAFKDPHFSPSPRAPSSSPCSAKTWRVGESERSRSAILPWVSLEKWWDKTVITNVEFLHCLTTTKCPQHICVHLKIFRENVLLSSGSPLEHFE